MAKVMIIGSGGREDTLATFFGLSENVDRLFTATGNADTPGNIDIDVTKGKNFEELADFVEEKNVDLTVVGPEAPLCAGLVDYFDERGLRIFGPSAAAAKLEGDKAFARIFMKEQNIPQPGFEIFYNNIDAAKAYLDKLEEGKVVVKASGLAGGKGAIVCENKDDAKKALEGMILDEKFGDAGKTVVIEEFMEGEEASIFAICDGEDAVYLQSSQDHKRAYDGDKGPNTGGMGAYAPAPIVTDEMLRNVDENIVKKTLAGMKQNGTPYKGCLYVGLMIKDNEPRVVEFNCRFGDPEIQVVLPLLKNDFYSVIEASVDGKLKDVKIENKDGAACCVVLASGGYPGSYEKGKVITGTEEAGIQSDVYVFHAGTKRQGDDIVTSGGRVLNIVGVGRDIREARDIAYDAVGEIKFDKMEYRTDIAHRALNR